MVKKAGQWLPRDGGNELHRGPKETFGGVGDVQYHDCGDGFTDIYMWQNLSNYALDTYNLLQVIIPP